MNGQSSKPLENVPTYQPAPVTKIEEVDNQEKQTKISLKINCCYI